MNHLTSMFSNIGSVAIWGSTMTMIIGNDTRGASAASREYMPSKPAIFHGREDLVNDISLLLCDEMTSRRVRILGPGGMGKTSLALAVVESPNVQSKYGSRCYWVPCVDAPSSSLLLQVLYTQLCSARTTATDDILSDILAELERVKEPTLLLLDNFETPWFPTQGTTKAVDDILFQLSECGHVAILLTMRLLGKHKAPCDRIKWHTRQLEPVSNEASRLIYHNIYPGSKEDPDVDTLLAAVGHMPYAVVLMAKSGETCEITAATLLEEWNQAGTHMISHSGSPEENMNTSISLSVNRGFVQDNPDALLLLQTLALLPAGTSIEHLRHWAPKINSLSSAIVSLSNAALLLRSEGHPMTPTTLSILPVVQSFMHTTGRIPKEVFQNVHQGCYHFILDHISQCENHPQDVGTLMITEDRNIHFVLLDPNPTNIPDSPDLHAKCVLYFAFASRYRRSPSICEHALKLARKLVDQKMVAQGLLALAVLHARKGACDTAEQYFLESYSIFSQLADPDSKQDAFESGLLLAHCRLLLNQPVIEFLQSFQATFDDGFQKARIKKLVGECLRIEGQFSDAVETLKEAKDLFTRTGHLAEVAETLGDISGVYLVSSQFEESLVSILEAREAAKSSGIPLNRAVFIDLKYGWLLSCLKRDAEALLVFQGCLPIFESAGELNGAKECFKHMGFIHARQGNHHDACLAFESAIAKLTEIGDTTASGRQEIAELERLKAGSVH